MYVKNLALTSIRNHKETIVDLPKGCTIISGANAQGKTNLVEALHYLAYGSSHRTTNTQALISHDDDFGVIRAELVNDDNSITTVSLELRPGKNRAAINDVVTSSINEVIGVVRAVMLAVEDLALIKGMPQDRRKFLDNLLGSRRVLYKSMLSDYQVALNQRNSILKDSKYNPIDEDLLAASTKTWLDNAAGLTYARIYAIHDLIDNLIQNYEELISASPKHDLDRIPQLSYVFANRTYVRANSRSVRPSLDDIKEFLEECLLESHDDERRRGVTMVGPHRDDLVFELGDFPAKDYASHGELWSYILSLKLATVDIIAATGNQPILILDDVFAELDNNRAQCLAEKCSQFDQVLITVAEGTNVPVKGNMIKITNGKLDVG